MKIDLRLPVYIVSKGYAYESNYGVFDYVTHIYTTYNHAHSQNKCTLASNYDYVIYIHLHNIHIYIDTVKINVYFITCDYL